MQNSLTLTRKKISDKVLLTLCAIAASVALPQIVHTVGHISGLGTSLGEALLPLHFFVFLVGLYAGPYVGGITGLCAPLISFWLSGMPRLQSLPFMMVELLGYGLIAGLLCQKKMPSFVKLLIAQIGGRLLRAASIGIAVGCFEVQSVTLMSVWKSIPTGLFGILLQWIVLPLLLFRLQSINGERS